MMSMRYALLLALLALPAGAQDAPVPETPSAQESAPGGDAEGQNIEDAGDPTDQILRIGVRSFARPFSSLLATHDNSRAGVVPNVSAKSGPLRAKGYDGYIVYICDEVLKQMLIATEDTPPLKSGEILPIDVDDEMKLRPGEDRLNLLGDKIDILCDPATISRERVRSYAVSPPLFLTGIGYLTRQGSVAPRASCQTDTALIGVVGTTNAAQYGVQAILDAGEWKRFRDQVIAALRSGDGSTESCPKPDDSAKVGGIIWAGGTHDEVAQKFCDGKLTYYVGDLEIILAHARAHPGCDPLATQSFTNDRYAIFARIDYRNKWKALRMARFFEILNREITTSDSLLDRAYLAEFGAAPKSPKLEFFFWSLRGAQ